MLRDAQSNVLCSLELRDLGLQKMPTEVVRLSELTALDLSNNQIKSLPRMEMPLLETLILDRNGFSAVPRTVYETLTCISRISLIDNPIVRLPTNLGEMPMMQRLDMNVNFQVCLRDCPQGWFSSLTSCQLHMILMSTSRSSRRRPKP